MNIQTRFLIWLSIITVLYFLMPKFQFFPNDKYPIYKCNTITGACGYNIDFRTDKVCKEPVIEKYPGNVTVEWLD